jgi:opacity protein-like surface antigen
MICHGKNNSNEYPKGFLRAGVAMLPLALAAPAQAVDLAWSGFGTLGYAQSDQPVNYQRFIDEKGTFKRDSVLGAQVDARFHSSGGDPAGQGSAVESFGCAVAGFAGLGVRVLAAER